jgi:hypothetical protein
VERLTVVNLRVKPEKPAKPLPNPRGRAVSEFVDFLFSIDEKVCRPPLQAAKLLAFIVQLYKARGGPRPFPTRPQVAKHLGMSVPTVDAVLNLHIAEGNLTVETRYRDGNIGQRRASVIKERYIVPSDVLIRVYEYRGE